MRTGFRTAPPSLQPAHTYVFIKYPSTDDWSQQTRLQDGATNVKTRREDAYRCRGTCPARWNPQSVCRFLVVAVSPSASIWASNNPCPGSSPANAACVLCCAWIRLWTRYLGPWLGSPHIHDPSLLNLLSSEPPLPCTPYCNIEFFLFLFFFRV